MNMKKIWYDSLMLGLLFISMVFASCSSDSDGDGSKTMGENNTTDVAVTGGVQETGMTFAVVKGFVNFTVPEAYASLGSLYSYGVEYATSKDFSDAKTAYGGSVVGRTFTATMKELRSNTQYFYRTYVDNMRGTEIGTFTTKALTYTGTMSASCSDVQFTYATFEGKVSAASLKNETFTVGVAVSSSKGELNANTYKKASFSNPDYNYEIQTAEIGGTVFVKSDHSGEEQIEFENNTLKQGNTYYYAAFIEVGGNVQFGETQTVTTRKLKNSGTFNSGTYTWGSRNQGAATPFDNGRNYYSVITTSNSHTGLDSETLSLRLPTPEAALELNSCKLEQLRNGDVVVTDKNGNELYMPYGNYLTNEVTYSSSRGHSRTYFLFNGEKFETNKYIVVYYDVGVGYVFLREAW